LIRRVLRNASQGLRSIVVFLAQHIVSYPDALNMHVDDASAALTRAGIKYDEWLCSANSRVGIAAERV
jgi:hypothetical protein